MAREPREPRASAAKVAYHMKQLRKMVAGSRDIAFLQMIWATDALQSGHAHAASAFITFPPQAADTAIGSPFAIHRWGLETLTIQLFLAEKQQALDSANLVVNCTTFDAIRETINRLRALENIESAFYLTEDFTILSEIHRIGQRQFHRQLATSTCRSSTDTPSFMARASAPRTSSSSTAFRLPSSRSPHSPTLRLTNARHGSVEPPHPR